MAELPIGSKIGHTPRIDSDVESTSEMEIYSIDPVRDRRWEEFLQTRSDASIFHTPAWFTALSNTYGYDPIVFTTSAPAQPITNGFAFCRVQSWMTGYRLVSVPFADHCQPLFDENEGGRSLAAFLPAMVKQEHCDYMEARLLFPEALGPALDRLSRSAAFLHHLLDLRRSEE